MCVHVLLGTIEVIKTVLSLRLYPIREHGSASLCRDGQKTKWRLQCN